jgi:heme A synthase
MNPLGGSTMATATRDAQDNARWIAGWLAVCAVTILGMILLGGVTRLTESGLSMVDWRPIMGVIPPLSESQWLETFATYQQYPEYQKLIKAWIWRASNRSSGLSIYTGCLDA